VVATSREKRLHSNEQPWKFAKRAIMFEIDAFVIRGHEKVIDHYRRLRDSSASESERQEFQRRMDEVGRTLQLYRDERLHGMRRAA